jgi:hypothetical protein
MRQTMAVAVGLEGFALLEGEREREREREGRCVCVCIVKVMNLQERLLMQEKSLKTVFAGWNERRNVSRS